MMKRKIGGMVLAAATVAMMGVMPVFAADTATTDVMFEAEAPVVDVMVPSTLPITFNNDGTNTVPTNFEIKNNGTNTVALSYVEMDAGDSMWRLLPENYDMSELIPSSQDIKFYINGKIVSNGEADSKTGTVMFSDNEQVVIAPGEKATLNFDVKRATFPYEIESEKAFTMTSHFIIK